MEAVLVINQINLYIIERPGFGLSTPHPNRNYQTWGDDIRQFIEGVIKQQAAVIGYSAGGPYAIACGKYLPELITKVFIISSPSPPETKKLYSEMDWMSKIGYFLARNWKWGLEKAVETEANKWIKNPVKQTKEFLIQGGSLGDAQTFLLNPSIHRAFVLSVMEQYSRGRVGIVTESHDYYLFSRPWVIIFQNYQPISNIIYGMDQKILASFLQWGIISLNIFPIANPFFLNKKVICFSSKYGPTLFPSSLIRS